MSLIASVLILSRRDIKALRITDPYSLHRVVYSLFEDIRSPSKNRLAKPVKPIRRSRRRFSRAKSADPFQSTPFHRGIFIKPAVFLKQQSYWNLSI